MSIFLSMDALFGFVAPIVASKINVKVDWSSPYFSQNFNTRINHVFFFRAITFAMSLVSIVGILMNQSYMDEVLRPVVLHFLCQNQCKNQARDYSARTHLAKISKTAFMRTKLCALTGQ